MTDQDQHVRVKCPHCGWVRRVPARVLEGKAPVTLGVREIWESVRGAVAGLGADRELDEANAWIDMPACPHCKTTYQYNVRSGECR
jgi:phage FluMu protein Com